MWTNQQILPRQPRRSIPHLGREIITLDPDDMINLRITPFLSFFWNLGRVENIRHNVETTTKRQETTAITWRYFTLTLRVSFMTERYLCGTGVVGIFKQIPQVFLCLGEESSSKILLRLLLRVNGNDNVTMLECYNVTMLQCYNVTKVLFLGRSHLAL